MSFRAMAEIDLAAVRHNIAELRHYVGLRTELMPIVKADGYGHGALEVAKTAVKCGIEWLGVATIAEGAELRNHLPGASICLLGPFAREDAEEVVLYRLTPVLSDIETARILSLAAGRMRGGLRVHLAVDVGMGREGVLPEHAAGFASHVARMSSILVTGLMTHFPSAESDLELTTRQLEKFAIVQRGVEATDTLLQQVHCDGSAAIIKLAASRMNMVRPGLLIYGILPNVGEDAQVPNIRPVLSLKSKVVLIRSLPEGHSVSYGCTVHLMRQSRIATIPIGYGDGYPRELSNVGSVIIEGKRAPILGRVCMDVIMVDVTDIPDAVVGSEAVLIGSQNGETIRVEELARLVGTTEHDITTRLLPRIQRRYVNP